MDLQQVMDELKRRTMFSGRNSLLQQLLAILGQDEGGTRSFYTPGSSDIYGIGSGGDVGGLGGGGSLGGDVGAGSFGQFWNSVTRPGGGAGGGTSGGIPGGF